MNQLEVPAKWAPKIQETRLNLEIERRNKQRAESKRNSILGPILSKFDEPKQDTRGKTAFKRRYKRTQVAGLFAYAKSSFNHTLSSQFEDYDYPAEEDQLGEAKRSRAGSISSKFVEVKRRSSPPHKNVHDQGSSSSVLHKTVGDEPRFEERQQSEDAGYVNPAAPENNTDDEQIDETKFELINTLSRRLEKPNIPLLYLRKENKLTLTHLETSVLQNVLKNKSAKKCQLMNVMSQRVDWLLYDENLNDTKDYEPEDPDYVDEVISEAYDRFKKFEEKRDAQYEGGEVCEISQDESQEEETTATMNEPFFEPETHKNSTFFDFEQDDCRGNSPDPFHDAQQRRMNETSNVGSATSTKGPRHSARSSAGSNQFPTYEKWKYQSSSSSSHADNHLPSDQCSNQYRPIYYQYNSVSKWERRK